MMQRGLPSLRFLISRGLIEGRQSVLSVQGPLTIRCLSRVPPPPDSKHHKDHGHHAHHAPQGLQPPWEIVRLGTENSYLSWCRNGYLCTVLTLSLHAHEGFVSDLSVLTFLLAVYNMTMGTGGYMYNMSVQRASTGSSRTACLFISSMAIGHFVVWFFTFMVYIGYAGSDESEEEAEEGEE